MMKSKKDVPLLQTIFTGIGLIGSLLWCLAVFLREANTPVSPFLLGIMPNFAAFWTFVGLAFPLYPVILKKPFDPAKLPILCGIVFFMALLSEWIHMAFLGAAFDWFDLLASLVALVTVLVISMLAQGLENRQKSQGGQEHGI